MKPWYWPLGTAVGVLMWELGVYFSGIVTLAFSAATTFNPGG